MITDEELDSMLHSKDVSNLAESESDNTPPETSKLTEVFAEFTPEKQQPG